MIEIDWEKFMRITPGSLSEEEKDEIYEAIVWFNPNDSLDRQYLIQFIHVSQEILKFKFRQVKTLTNKLDEVTSKSEKETSSKLQNYVDEIKLLRDELDYYKKVGRNNESFASSSNEDLKRELLKSQVQAKELFKELKEKEKDLMHERKEVERYASQVATLEIKEQEVKRELKALQEEIVQKTSESLQGSPESGVEKQGVCTEIIREKNKHIQQLLEDIEVMENENISLRSKISSIKDELSETISHMVEITAELSKLRHLNKEYVSREADFKDKINSLMFQIEELVEEKTKINNKFDEYVLMFNEKVQEWKEVLDLKDNEIIKLKNEIKDLYSSTNAISASEAADAQLNKKLIQQQEQIEILQLELQNATEDIRSSSELIEKLKEKQIHLLSGPLHSQSSTILLEEKIKVLEEKLIYAEEDAHVKAEEMSDLVIQLREYESNVFGLPEAVEKIKKLEKTIEKKDFQAERLIEICNNLEMKLDNLEQQNLALRDRLGLSISDEIDTSGVVLKYKKDEELMQNLKCQLNRKEEELIKVKLKCRKLMTSAKMFPSKAIMQCPVKFENKKLQTDTSQLDEKLPVKLELILKENDALRKGMHEILESIREQNCLGTVEVQSTSLKRLLEALDSRHVSGWYHPAMRLQAQLCSEEGKNDELRNQIRSMRAEEKKKASELQNAYLKIQSLENDFSNSRLEEEKEAQSENSSSTGEGRNSPVAYLAHTVLERKVIELESRLHESKMMCDSKVANFEEKEKLFMAEKEMLLVKLEELECQVNMFKNQNQHSNFKEFCELTSQITVLNRKVNYLTNLESSNNQNYRKLKQEFIDQEEKMLQDILKLQNQKLELLYKIENLEKTVLNAVPVEKFVSVSNELATIQAKYKCAISLVLVEESDNNENLKTEISLLQSEKQFLLDELKIAKEKLIVAEALISEEAVTKGDFSNEISAFARNLAASETRELNEKQKCTHLEKINNALLLQQSEFEGRNKELLEKVEKLTEENFKLKEVERNLREKVLNHFAGEERNVLEAKVEKLEEKVLKLSAEKENIQELFEISQGQCRAYQEWKDADQILLSSQNEQILLLQASNDNAASISRLSHELTMSKLLTSELTKKNNDLKIQLTKLLAENLNLEGKILEHRNEFFKTKKKHLTHVGYLYQTISEIRTIYGCSVVFRDLEEVYNMKLDLKKEKKKLVGKMSSLKTESQEYLLKKAEMEAQLEGLEDLKTALKSDAKNLITWHNKSTELRIKEAKYRRENDFLIEEVSQLRNRVKKLNEELILLEQKNIEREKEWEGKQLLWEENQFKMSMLLQKQGTEENFKIFCDASTFTDNITENIGNDSLERESVLAQEENAPLMNEGVAELKESQRKEENIGTAEDKEFCDINNTSKILDFEQRTCQRKIDSKEKEAFRVTIGSLQSIIKQKEETILRYQDLLKRGREEHGKAYSKLQEELKTLNGALAVQSRAYNKLKNAVQMNHFSGDNVPLIVEKYVTTIQELEEELRECQLNLSSVNTQAFANKQEVEKWKNLATERLLQLEDSRRRIELSHENEIENYKEDIRKYQVEVERLTAILAYRNDEATNNDNDGNQQIQTKEPELDSDPLKSDQFSNYVNGCDKSEKQIHELALKDVDVLKKQLKLSKEEILRLKNQIRLIQSQPPKRPRTTGSLTSRSDSKSSVREGCLTSKIKNLEELLTMSKEKEKELVEINKKKLKSAEEVARWEERKKNQKLIQNLNLKLKEKEAEVEVLTNKSESFRIMVSKCERDKVILESQLKAVKGNFGDIRTKVEKLTSEKNQLETEVNILRNKLDEHKRHSSGIAAALMHEKLEAQERKLMAFELASKGQSAILEEFEKLKIANTNLEKVNLKLESENLSLKLKIEKEKVETKYFMEKIKHLQQAKEEIKCRNCEKTSSHLKTIEKLTEENKRLLKGQKVTATSRELDKVKNDLQKLKEDHKLLSEKYLESMDKNIVLEDEVKSYRYQIHLMEEKDLAELLVSDSSGFQTSSKLFQEINELKKKLVHKNNLLNRVKTLLIKAAAKEKALHQGVRFLQNETLACALEEGE